MVQRVEAEMSGEDSGQEPEGHQQQMIDKAEGKQPEENQRPEYIPEKFWDAEKGEANLEALAKSYTELEKTRSGKPKADPDNPGDPETTEDKPKDDNDLQIKKDTPSDVLQSFTEKYQENGELSDEDYEEIKTKLGFDRHVVDQFIAGAEAEVQSLRNTAFEITGGQEQYQAVLEWAKANLSQSEQDAFNEQIGANTKDAVTVAVTSLYAKYINATGKKADLLKPDGSNKSGEGYASWAEYQKDVANPEYKKSEDYRQKVYAKLQLSNF